MKKRNLLLIFILIIPILFLSNISSIVKADSGFDAGYDGGGYSGGDYGTDYSWSYSNNRDDISLFGSDDPFVMIIYIVIFIVILVSIIYKTIKADKNYIPGRKIDLPEYHTSPSLSDEEIGKIIPGFDSKAFINDRFNDFIEIQNAWMNFDYDTLREKLTDELYNQYIMQLDSMKLKNKQNIMKGFKLDNGKVIDIKEENNILEITIEMTASFYDYIICDGLVERGNANDKIMITYEMVFVSNEEAIDKCPNCHAELTDSSSQVCEYCRTVITRAGNKWVMSKKKNKKQW